MKKIKINCKYFIDLFIDINNNSNDKCVIMYIEHIVPK